MWYTASLLWTTYIYIRPQFVTEEHYRYCYVSTSSNHYELRWRIEQKPFQKQSCIVAIIKSKRAHLFCYELNAPDPGAKDKTGGEPPENVLWNDRKSVNFFSNDMHSALHNQILKPNVHSKAWVRGLKLFHCLVLSLRIQQLCRHQQLS